MSIFDEYENLLTVKQYIEGCHFDGFDIYTINQSDETIKFHITQQWKFSVSHYSLNTREINNLLTEILTSSLLKNLIKEKLQSKIEQKRKECKKLLQEINND